MYTVFSANERIVTRSRFEGEQTYTVSFQNYDNIPSTVITKADTEIRSGFLEKVTETLIVYHDLRKCDIETAMNLIAQYYGNILVTLEEEHYNGNYCYNKFIVAVKL